MGWNAEALNEASKPVTALILLLALLLGLHHWLMEPLLWLGEAALELRALPWLLLVVLAWVVSGRGGARP